MPTIPRAIPRAYSVSRADAEPGHHDHFAGGGIGADDFQHGAVDTAGAAPGVGEAQEAVAEEPAQVPVVDADRGRQRAAQDRAGLAGGRISCGRTSGKRG